MSFAEMYKLVKGKKDFRSLYFSALFVLILGVSIFYFLFKDEDGNFLVALSGIISFVLGIIMLYILHKGETTYVPGKTYKLLRLKKEGLKKMAIWSFVLCGILYIIFAICMSWLYSLGFIITLFFFLLVIYSFIKSIEVHENVDYVTNQAIEKMLGVDIDEKIYASYQNFDNTRNKPQKGDNLIVMTNKKIFYTTYNGNTWMILKRQFKDLNKIGYSGYYDAECFLFLEFADSSSICLRMDAMGKLTSNPNLFMKQFINMLDAYVLGNDMIKTQTRRRVIANVSSDEFVKCEKLETISSVNNSTRKINLEIDDDLVAQIKIGEEIGYGRRLEL